MTNMRQKRCVIEKQDGLDMRLSDAQSACSVLEIVGNPGRNFSIEIPENNQHLVLNRTESLVGVRYPTGPGWRIPPYCTRLVPDLGRGDPVCLEHDDCSETYALAWACSMLAPPRHSEGSDG